MFYSHFLDRPRVQCLLGCFFCLAPTTNIYTACRQGFQLLFAIFSIIYLSPQQPLIQLLPTGCSYMEGVRGNGKASALQMNADRADDMSPEEVRVLIVPPAVYFPCSFRVCVSAPCFFHPCCPLHSDSVDSAENLLQRREVHLLSRIMSLSALSALARRGGTLSAAGGAQTDKIWLKTGPQGIFAVCNSGTLCWHAHSYLITLLVTECNWTCRWEKA